MTKVRAMTTAEDASSSQDKQWLRYVYWACFVVGPILTSLAFLDVAAHMQGTAMIGLEGGGAPNAIPFLFAALAFGCVTGAIFARTVLDPKPSFMRALLLGFVVFLATGFLSRPIFHWKWEHDCAQGVAKACYAIGAIDPDPNRRAELTEKACGLGDPRACPSASASADASAAPSSSTPMPQ